MRVQFFGRPECSTNWIWNSWETKLPIYKTMQAGFTECTFWSEMKRGGLFLRGCGIYWLCDNIHLVWWRITLFGLRRPWSTGAASGSGSRGQQRSGVTTLTYIPLHSCRGLRVKYCSRRSNPHFSHWSIYVKLKSHHIWLTHKWTLISSQICMFQLFKLRNLEYLYIYGWQLKDSSRWAHLCGGSVHGPDLISYLASQVNAKTFKSLHYLHCSDKTKPLY